MDEQKAKNPNEKNELKNQTAPKKEGKISAFFKDFKAEFRKIIWPSRDELAKKTVTVIITSLLIGVLVFALDTVYTTGYSFILNLLG